MVQDMTAALLMIELYMLDVLDIWKCGCDDCYSKVECLESRSGCVGRICITASAQLRVPLVWRHKVACIKLCLFCLRHQQYDSWTLPRHQMLDETQCTFTFTRIFFQVVAVDEWQNTAFQAEHLEASAMKMLKGESMKSLRLHSKLYSYSPTLKMEACNAEGEISEQTYVILPNTRASVVEVRSLALRKNMTNWAILQMCVTMKVVSKPV